MYIKTVGSLLKQAVALKYNFLSLRKFNLLCKTQSSAFDADQEVWVSHNMKCLGTDLKVSLSVISVSSQKSPGQNVPRPKQPNFCVQIN
jgi:hypothetical protein